MFAKIPQRVRLSLREGILLVSLVMLAVAACTNDLDDGNPLSASSIMRVVPPVAQTNPLGTVTFTATGAVGAVTWVVDDVAGGTIGLATGIFTAAAEVGGVPAADQVIVTALDTGGNTATATVNIIDTTP